MGRELASRNPWWWTVLTLLHERPMHPYEIQRLTTERGKDFLVEHKAGSLYSVIESLHRDGLIATVAITRSGKLPKRTVYRITERGRQTLLDWLDRELADPPKRDLPLFAFAVEKIVHLFPDQARVLFDQRVLALRKHIGLLDQILADTAIRDVPPVSLLEIDYARTVRQAELGWLEKVLDALDSGRLDWDPPHRESDLRHPQEPRSRPDAQIEIPRP